MKQKMFWGGSSSAFQFEGGANEGGKGISFYDAMSKSKNDFRESWMGNSSNKDYSTTSDFYHHYPEDIALMKELGLTAFRMSISWTRIIPYGEGEVNQEGIQFYKNVFSLLKENGIEPVVTLYHWDIPQALVDKYHGWYGKETVEAFKKYTDICFESFGKYVQYWLTLNENNLTIAMAGFGTGMKVSKDDPAYDEFAYRIYHNTNIAHFYAVKRCHEIIPNSKVGCMIASSLAYPLTSDPKDVLITRDHNQKLTYDYLDLLTKGKYTRKNQIEMESKGITFYHEEEELFLVPNSKIDFISFSYYFTVCTGDQQNAIDENAQTMQMMYSALHNPRLKQSTFGWTIDPIGLRILMNDLYDRYQLPVMIVENGLGVKDDLLTKEGTVHDPYRIAYFKSHIDALMDAVEKDHVECLGYLPWGIIDLYSASGDPSKRYGVIYVDYQNGCKRYKKDSFYFYQKVIQNNGKTDY